MVLFKVRGLSQLYNVEGSSDRVRDHPVAGDDSARGAAAMPGFISIPAHFDSRARALFQQAVSEAEASAKRVVSCSVVQHVVFGFLSVAAVRSYVILDIVLSCLLNLCLSLHLPAADRSHWIMQACSLSSAQEDRVKRYKEMLQLNNVTKKLTRK